MLPQNAKKPALWAAILLCALSLAAVPASGGHPPSDASAPREFDATDILPLGEKSILDCNAVEVYAALGEPAERDFLYYEGATGNGFVEWLYDGMTVTLYTSDPKYCDSETDLSAIPYEEAALQVREVTVTGEGVSGPRGIRPGMLLDEVLAVFPSMDNPPALEYGGILLYRNPMSDDSFAGMAHLPPYGLLLELESPEGDEGARLQILELNYIEPEFYTRSMAEFGFEPQDYVYWPQYILSISARDGVVTSYSLYRGATAE